jgi:hypothetical protein
VKLLGLPELDAPFQHTPLVLVLQQAEDVVEEVVHLLLVLLVQHRQSVRAHEPWNQIRSAVISKTGYHSLQVLKILRKKDDYVPM